MKTVRYIDLGYIEYGKCLEEQQRTFNAIITAKTDNGTADQYLYLCEHPHVYTLGKSGHRSNMLIGDEFLKKIGATYVLTDRGGDITYHGPGQLVGYPILDLDSLEMGLKEYIAAIEQSIIDMLAEFGIVTTRSAGAAGVWLEATEREPLRKICAIGVRSSRFVTMHGFALNVNTQLDYFSHINPCGFTDRGVTSMQKELGTEIDMNAVKRAYVDCFRKTMRNIKII